MVIFVNNSGEKNMRRTSSKILKAMTETQIVSLLDEDEVSKYEGSMKQQRDEIVKEYNAA